MPTELFEELDEEIGSEMVGYLYDSSTGMEVIQKREKRKIVEPINPERLSLLGSI